MSKEILEDEAAAWRLIAKRLAGGTKFKHGFCYYFMMGGALVGGITAELRHQMSSRVEEHMEYLTEAGAQHAGDYGASYLDVPGKRKIRTLAALLLAEECDDEAEAAL